MANKNAPKREVKKPAKKKTKAAVVSSNRDDSFRFVKEATKD
jgi:hypothetical protein